LKRCSTEIDATVGHLRGGGAVELQVEKLDVSWKDRAFDAFLDGRNLDAAAAYREGAADPVAAPCEVAGSLYNCGVLLGSGGEFAASVCVYDELIARFGDAVDPDLRQYVARTYVNRAGMLAMLDRPDEALAAFDDTIARFGDSGEWLDRDQVARALRLRGNVLGELGRTTEELASYDALAERFAQSTQPGTRREIDLMLASRGAALGKLGRTQEAIVVLDAVIEGLAETDRSDLLEQLEFPRRERSRLDGA
jgi:tetratricopeptide (TPR) repeat protein